MIRDYKPSDLQRIIDIHKTQGLDYSLPDISSPLFLVKKVREENGTVTGALMLRMTAETFLLCEGSPVAKGRAIEELQPEVLREAWEKGLDDIICVVPPEISFDPVLMRMGWCKDRPWQMWSRRLDAECTKSGK